VRLYLPLSCQKTQLQVAEQVFLVMQLSEEEYFANFFSEERLNQNFNFSSILRTYHRLEQLTHKHFKCLKSALVITAK